MRFGMKATCTLTGKKKKTRIRYHDVIETLLMKLTSFFFIEAGKVGCSTVEKYK